MARPRVDPSVRRCELRNLHLITYENATSLQEKLVEMRSAGYTLMLVEQNAVRALGIADRAYVLELGRNRFEGPGPQLLADPEVKRLYLGG